MNTRKQKTFKIDRRSTFDHDFKNFVKYGVSSLHRYTNVRLIIFVEGIELAASGTQEGMEVYNRLYEKQAVEAALHLTC